MVEERNGLTVEARGILPGYWPVPESATEEVAAGLLAVMARLAVSAPVAVGANWTRTMQLEPGASVAPQLLTWAKEAAPVPPSAMEVRFRGVVVLEFVRVTACATLVVACVTEPKLSVVEESVSTGAAAPVPLSDTVWVVGDALSVKTRLAERLPEAVGAMRTKTVQLAAAASEAGQLLILVKEVGLVPLSVMEEKDSGPVPELLRVMAWAGL